MGRAVDAAASRAFDHGATNRREPQQSANYDSVTLAVEGMYCGTCIRSVETAVAVVPGVRSARANLSARRVTAFVDGRRVTSERLIEALEAEGYKAAEITAQQRVIGETGDIDLMRRLGVAGFAAMNIMLLSVSVWAGSGADMDQSVQTLFHWLSALIALPVVAYSGKPFFRSAAHALTARRLNMDVPISLGVILATAMSLYQTAYASDQVYFDAAVTLLAFLLLGRMLDEQMRTKASSAATNLLGLKSSAASVRTPEGQIVRLPLKAIEPGMTISAAAGERIAVDGVAVEGESDVDQSLITGESVPRRVRRGDEVYAGTINLTCPLLVKATKREENTLLSEITELMATAEQGRGRYVRLADRAARLYAPAVHLLGLSTFLGWVIAGNSWEQALTAGIAVLIVTCPCALALAVPAIQVAAASRLFSKGIILKAADGLERLAETDTVVLDKTGTLTLGEPRLSSPSRPPSAMLAEAAGLAASSRHPYSRAIVVAAVEAGLRVPALTGVIETPGAGLAHITSEGEQRLGSARWCGVDAENARDGDLWFKPAQGAPVPLRFTDALRPDSRDVARKLANAGYHLEILSGDATSTVSAVAADTGISAWRADQRPDQKIARIQTLKEFGHKVLMVGDGLNDAPALAAAHASLSPCAAADISQTVSDVVFQGSKLSAVIEVLAVAKAAHFMALENFALAVGYNIIFVPLAMAGLVTPLIAAIAMSASSISVTANAVRLRTKILEV